MKTKTIWTSFLYLAIGSWMFAAAEDSAPSTKGFLFPKDPSSGTVEASASWKALNSVPWIHFENESGNASDPCRFSVAANDTGETRIGVFYVDFTKVTVTQALCRTASTYEQKAKDGDAESQFCFGYCHDYGLGVEKDAAKAVEWYRKSAEQGNARAQCNLGWCYDFGQGVEKDAAKAVEWDRKSAEQGNAAAQFKLGVRYHNGEGVEKDAAKAVEWYRKSAEQGNARAQCNLGVCYYSGEGVEKDAAKAVEWYRKSAEQGNARAQFALGVCYELGRGIEKDAAKAVEWYRKSAEQGDAAAQYNLGACYANGKVVEKDVAKAVEWARKAAEQGDAAAQYNLGVCYEFGEGVEKDAAKAVEWYRKAAEQGNEEAKTKLAEMSPDIEKLISEHKELKGFYPGMPQATAEALARHYGIQSPWVSSTKLVFKKADLTTLFNFGVSSYEDWAVAFTRHIRSGKLFQDLATELLSDSSAIEVCTERKEVNLGRLGWLDEDRRICCRTYYRIKWKPGIKVVYYGALTARNESGETEIRCDSLKVSARVGVYAVDPGTLVVEAVETF